MTKDQLVDSIVAITNQTHPDLGIGQQIAKAVIDATMNSIVDAVSEGDTVTLRRFGTFGPKCRQAKTARNIAAGTVLTVAAHTIPLFKPSTEFKAIVRDAQPVNQ